jgi:hypothetical protein
MWIFTENISKAIICLKLFIKECWVKKVILSQKMSTFTNTDHLGQGNVLEKNSAD